MGEAAVVVVAACARARVKLSTGVYAAWSRTLTGVPPEASMASFKVLTTTSLAFARAGVQLDDPSFWQSWLAEALEARIHMASAADIAAVVSAYAVAGIQCPRSTSRAMEQVILSNQHLQHADGSTWLNFEPRHAALLLWGHRQSGRLNGQLFERLWSHSLDGRLAELTSMGQLAAVVDYATALRGVRPQVAKQLVLNLQHRVASKTLVSHPGLLCHSLAALCHAQMAEPQDMWPLIGGIVDLLDEMDLASLVDSLSALVAMRVFDVALLKELQVRIFALLPAESELLTPGCSMPQGAAVLPVWNEKDDVPSWTTLSRRFDVSGLANAAVSALDAFQTLSETSLPHLHEVRPSGQQLRRLCHLVRQSFPGRPDSQVDPLTLSQVASRMRAACALLRAGCEDDARVLLDMRAGQSVHASSLDNSFGDAADMEAILRCSSSLPGKLRDDKLVDNIASAFLSEVIEASPSSSLSISVLLSGTLLGRRQALALREFVSQDLHDLPTSELLTLCLVTLLDGTSGSSGQGVRVDVEVDWNFMFRVLHSLGNRGPDGFEGMEALLLSLVQDLHSRGRGQSPNSFEWPPSLRATVVFPVAPGTPRVSDLASADSPRRLCACLSPLFGAAPEKGQEPQEMAVAERSLQVLSQRLQNMR